MLITYEMKIGETKRSYVDGYDTVVACDGYYTEYYDFDAPEDEINSYLTVFVVRDYFKNDDKAFRGVSKLIENFPDDIRKALIEAYYDELKFEFQESAEDEFFGRS